MPDSDLNSKHNRSWPWLWLAYVGFLFIEPILEPYRHLWFPTLGVLAIFIGIFAIYVRSPDQSHSLHYWMIASTFLLGLLTFPWNSGGSTFFVYAAAFLPFAIPSVRVVLGLFIAESIVIIAEGYLFSTRGHFFYIGWPNVVIAISLVFLIGGGNIFFAEQKRAENKLRIANEEIHQLAALAERERIARDLHDVLGHTLSVIVLKAELARRLIERDPARAAQEIAEVERTARTALTEVRETIGGYRSQGLPAELEQARNTLQSAGVALACESPLPQLHATEETVLCLAVREAVTNIVRHAHATHCTVRFATSPDGYRTLLIADNGAPPNLQEGNGLRGMRERVQSLGGRLSISTDPGVTLLIELPQSTSTQTRASCVVQ
jgi:two-component system, NarL family, sensor histidine kinase DesK